MNEDGSVLVLPATSVTLLASTTGAAVSTSGASRGSSSAAASCLVREMLLVLAWPPTRPTDPEPWTMRTLVPRLSIRDWTAFDEPLPTAIRMITEATPIAMPSTVRPDRSLFEDSPPHAVRSVSAPIIGRPRRSPPRERDSAGGRRPPVRR